MEEKVKDFFENIKDRVSNPLIFSFVLTWLVYNWKITISLIWYDKSQITAEGCKSIFEFIDDEWNRNGSLKEPIIIAFLYTILLPIFKNLNRLLNSIIYKYGDILDFKILKGSSVSVEKYLKFRDLYLKRTEELKEVIKVEEEFIVENNNLKYELERSKEN